MIIAAIDGSPIVETDLETRVKKELRKLIQKENHIIFYFYTDNPFVLQCEWVVRELQAAYPKKQIESVAVLGDEGRKFPLVRFTRIECISDGTKQGTDCWRWMIDKADYVLCYMHPALCSSKGRLSAYQYATKKLGSRCINFATQDAWEQVCKQVPSLVRWERKAFEGHLQKRSRKDVAAEMGVHPSTVRAYEVAARRSLVKSVYTKPNSHRKCAILDFTTKSMLERKRNLLRETFEYLIRCGGVSEFILSDKTYERYMELMDNLLEVCNKIPWSVKISTMQPEEDHERKWQYGEPARTCYCYQTRATTHATRSYEERKAIIDAADIVLCCVEHTYRSGLSYAQRLHKPVINLAQIESSGERNTNGEGQQQ